MVVILFLFLPRTWFQCWVCSVVPMGSNVFGLTALGICRLLAQKDNASKGNEKESLAQRGKANVMKVMKSMKAKPLPKGSKNMAGKGTGSSTDKKLLAKRGQRTMKLKRANLAKLGKLTLAEKVQKASENRREP